MSRRPQTAASGRPSTSASTASEPQSLFYQPGQQHYQHNEHALWEDVDEDDDEAETDEEVDVDDIEDPFELETLELMEGNGCECDLQLNSPISSVC